MPTARDRLVPKGSWPIRMVLLNSSVDLHLPPAGTVLELRYLKRSNRFCVTDPVFPSTLMYLLERL